MLMIRHLVTRTGGNSEDVKDIFQEGLMILIEKTDDRNFALTCRFKTFLYCICKHLWDSVIEQQGAAANYFARRLEDDAEKDINDIIDNKLYKDIFRESYELIDAPGRDILRLYWDEVPPQEIADKLGYTYGYVRKKKCEAQAELTERVKLHPDFIKIRKSEKVNNNVVH